MGLRPAADHGDFIDMRAAVGQRVHPVAKSKSHAFKHGLPDGSGVAFMGQAEKHTLGTWIIVRSAFARQIGEEDFAG